MSIKSQSQSRRFDDRRGKNERKEETRGGHRYVMRKRISIGDRIRSRRRLIRRKNPRSSDVTSRANNLAPRLADLSGIRLPVREEINGI